MIARKEVDLYPRIGHKGDLTEEAYMTPRDDRAVLKPVVEHIPEEVHRTSIPFDALKPPYQTALYRPRVSMIARPQMCIAREVDLSPSVHSLIGSRAPAWLLHSSCPYSTRAQRSAGSLPH